MFLPGALPRCSLFPVDSQLIREFQSRDNCSTDWLHLHPHSAQLGLRRYAAKIGGFAWLIWLHMRAETRSTRQKMSRKSYLLLSSNFVGRVWL